MHYNRMSEIVEAEFDRIRGIRESKGREYAQDEDTLADFKEVAAESGVTWFQCWNVYVKKHVRAVDTFIREGAVKSESIEGRIRDVIVYHLLLLGLIEDAKALERIEHPGRFSWVCNGNESFRHDPWANTDVEVCTHVGCSEQSG